MSKLTFTSSLLCLAAAAAFLPVGCASSADDATGSVVSALASDGGSAGSLVISQVFGGSNAFVEVFNPTRNTITMDGLSVQTAAGSGDFGVDTGAVVPLTGTLKAGGYFLVGRSGVAGTDATATFNLDATDGKVAIATTTSALGCGGGTICTTAQYLDLVGYGATTQSEGVRITGMDASKSAQRKLNGCTDTNNNANDFAELAPTSPARNSSTAANLCSTGSKDAGGDSATPIGVTDPDLPDDNGTGTDGGVDAGKAAATAAQGDSGCSMGAAGAANASALGLLFAAGFAVAGRRRRRK